VAAFPSDLTDCSCCPAGTWHQRVHQRRLSHPRVSYEHGGVVPQKLLDLGEIASRTDNSYGEIQRFVDGTKVVGRGQICFGEAQKR